MTITLNGKDHAVPSGCTISSLLRLLGLTDDRVAVELNRQIIRRDNWESTEVPASACVEIVQFVGGG